VQFFYVTSIKCILLGDENTVTVQFNKKAGKKIFTGGSALVVLIPQSKKWFDYGSRKISGHFVFCYDSILLTGFYTYCSLCNREL